MGGLLEQLAIIRERAGREPLPDPTQIQGPPLPIEPTEGPTWEDEEDEIHPSPPPGRELSPLVPSTAERPTAPRPEGPALDPKLELLVMNGEAAYRGRAVVLNQEERAEIVKAVLGAIRREVDAQYLEVAGKAPRRRRASTVSAKASTSASGSVGTGASSPAPSSGTEGRKPRIRRKGLKDLASPAGGG